MTRFPGCTLVLWMLVAPAALAQTPPVAPPGARPSPTAPPGAARPGLPPRGNAATAPLTGTGIVRGRIVALETGAPLRRASVSISSAESQLRRVTTSDAEGRYEFADLPAGRLSLSANKAGYVTLQYGQRRPFEGGTPLVLAEGQTLESVDLALPRGSVVAGRVTDEFGEPMAAAQVQVMRQQYGPDGQRRLAVAGMGTTNDLGDFRVFGLMPGEYTVNAGVRGNIALNLTASANDVSEGYPPTYYPGTLNPAEAQLLSVGTGQEVSVHLSLLPARMMRVSGTVVDSQDRQVSGAPIMLRASGGIGFMLTSAGMVAPDGTFTIANVSPGEYMIDVRPPPRSGELPEFASVPVTVGSGDVTGLRIVTGRGAVLSGRVIFEGDAPKTLPPGLAAARVLASPADPVQVGFAGMPDAQMNGTIQDDGTFQLAGVMGRVFVNAVVGPAWTIKSVTLDGDDFTDVPMDVAGRSEISGLRVVLTDKLTDVSGSVTADGKAMTDYVVVILPEQLKEGAQPARFIRIARPDTNGRFRFRGMRPGRYVAAAVESLEQGRQFVPEFQEQLRRRGRAFDVREGGSASLTIEIAPGL